MGVADDCKHAFLELKWKKIHRYLVFKIDEKTKQVVVEKTGGPAESYDDFTSSLPTIAGTLSMTSILSPTRTVRKERSSSLHRNEFHPPSHFNSPTIHQAHTQFRPVPI